MKTTSTSKALLAAAVTAALALATPGVRGETQDKGFFPKFKGDFKTEATSGSRSSARSISDTTQYSNPKHQSRTMASQNNKDNDKSFGSSLKFWDRDNDMNSSRSDNRRWNSSNSNRDPQHRSVMKRNQRAESKPSLMDRLMFWRDKDRS